MRPHPLPPPLASRPFSTAEAVISGLTYDRLRARDLRSPHRGARTTTDAVDLRGRCDEFAPLLRPGEHFAHVTALGLWELPLPRWVEEAAPLHVSAPGERQRRRPGVVGHRYEAASVAMLASLPVALPREALVQATAALRLDVLVALGDALAGTWSPHPEARLVPVSELRDTAAEARGRPGARRLREAMQLVRAGVDSPRETALRLLVVRAGLPEPEVNVRRFAADGSYLGKPDLSWAEPRVALEFQGDHHRADRETWRYDLRRREGFEDDGWRVVLVSDDDLRGAAAHALVARLARLIHVPLLGPSGS
jgi:very-short-patch-repair endonuclease